MISGEFIKKIGAVSSLDPDEIADAIWLVAKKLSGVTQKASTPDEPKRSTEAIRETRPKEPIPNEPKEALKKREKDPDVKTGKTPEPEGKTSGRGEGDKANISLKGNTPIGPEPDGKVLPLRVPGARALPGAREMSRALRPFRSRVDSRTLRTLDEEMTVQRIAENRVWVPVQKPKSSRQFEIALVIDNSPSMAIWTDTLKELRLLLEHLGAFKDVRLWWLDASSAGGPTLRARSGLTTPRNPRELLAPDGRRIIMIASDCLAPAWASLPLVNIIQEWGERQPVVLLQMLPQTIWRRTFLGASFVEHVYVSSKESGAPNRLLQKEYWRATEEDGVPQGTPLPIITTDPDLMRAWAKMVFHPSQPFFPGVIFNSESRNANLLERPASVGKSDQDQSAAIKAVQAFRDASSPQAFQLATLLAAAPLRLPIMRLVQRTLLPLSRQVHLAEFFLSGLIRRTKEFSTLEKENPDFVDYEFTPWVRETLLAESAAKETVRVLRAVSDYLKDKLGHSLDIDAIIATPAKFQGAQIASSGGAFAQIAAQVLNRLGGEYSDLARQIAVASSSRFEKKRILWVASVPVEQKYDERLVREGAYTEQTLSVKDAFNRLGSETVDAVILNASNPQQVEADLGLLNLIMTSSLTAGTAVFFNEPAVGTASGVEVDSSRSGIRDSLDEPKLRKRMLAGAIVATDSFEEVCEALAKRFASKPTEPPLPELTFETIESTLKDIPRPWAGVVISRAIQRGFAVASTLDIKGQVEDLVSRYLREVAEFAELTFIRTRGSPPQPPAQGQLQSRSKLLMDLIKAVQMLGSMIVDGAEIASSLSEELRRFDTQISKKNAIFREVIKGWLSAIGDDISLARTLPNSPPLAQVPSFICNFLPLKGDTLPSRPARWILVAGLGKQLGPDLDVVCRWLGHVLAMAGFGLVSGGWPGVDEVVTRSFVDRLRSGNADPKNCLRQIIEPGRQPVISEGEIVYTESQQAAFSQSIEEVHAVVLVNGAGGTRRLGELALKMGIPVLPLRVTGGDAAQLFVLLSAKRVSWPSKFLSPRWEILEGDAVSAVAGVPGELRRIFDHTATEDDPQPPKVVFDDLLGIDPEDQNKGRFGGKSEAYGRALSVEVDLDSSTPAAFYFDIVVRSVDGTRLAGPVEFFLHESYKRTKITVKKISASEARLSDVSAYETFTIGAQVKDAANVWRRLELDLATVKDAERWLPKSAPAKPRTAVAFIFQNRFENLNFSEKLRPRQEIVWKVSRYRSMIRSGSLILFWQAQGEGSEFVKGFWGWGVALTDSQRKRGEWSVKVRCIEKWSRSGSSAPIEAKEIFRLPAWKAHALKTMPQGTNFVLDAQQLEGIVALAEKYAGGSRLPAAAKAVVLGAKINQELFVGGDIYWNWPETATADSDPLDNWLKLGKEIRVTDRIAFNDPENESYGTYVTTRGNHVLDFPPRIRICPNPVTNQAFQKFVLDGGYEQKTYWTGKGEASLRSFQTNDHRSLGPSSWASQLDFGKQEPLAPVSGICWHEARAFVRWLNLRHPQGGWTWAIPTEDAWELAARGPNGLIYPWGNTFEVGLCNSAEAGIGRPSEINKFPRGESYYGGHDFAGNVWEFVRDEPESVKSQFCVLRGGSYVNTKDVVKSYLRLWGISKSLRAPDFGFRCGLVPVTPEGQPVAPPVFPKTPSRLK